MLRVMDSANERLVCISARGAGFHVNDKEGMKQDFSLDEVQPIGLDTKSAIINDKLVILQDMLRYLMFIFYYLAGKHYLG